MVKKKVVLKGRRDGKLDIIVNSRRQSSAAVVVYDRKWQSEVQKSIFLASERILQIKIINEKQKNSRKATKSII